MKNKKLLALQILAIFCIYLMVNITVVQALTISHNPSSDVAVSGTDASIRWTTDKPADSDVAYGETSSLGKSSAGSDLVTDHSITLTGLLANTTYYYGLISKTADNEAAEDNNSGRYYTFSTPEAGAAAGPLGLNVSLPQFYNRNQLTFGGFTDPDCVLKLYVNPSPGQVGTGSYDYITTSDKSGYFMFQYVNVYQETKLVIFITEKKTGRTLTQEYSMTLDTESPVVTMATLPRYAESNSLVLNGTVSEDVNATITVGTQSTQQTVPAGKFQMTVNLQSDVVNSVTIQFADKAGNIVERNGQIKVDTQPITIVWSNLMDLNPSYIQEVTVKGNVSKPGATVIVFVNNQTTSSEAWSTSMRDIIVHFGRLFTEGDRRYTAIANENGYFEIPIFLTQNIVSVNTAYTRDPYRTTPQLNGESGYYNGPGGVSTVTSGTAQTTYGTGPGYTGKISTGGTRYANAWDNQVTIVAVDDVGRTATSSGIVTFAKCGFGADWNIQIGKVTPAIITPEHLRYGLAQVAFDVKLNWQGPTDPLNKSTTKGVTILGDPQISPYTLSPEERKKYTFDPGQIMGSPIPFWDQSHRRGYIVIDLNKADYLQKNLSDLNKKELTIKLPLMMTIEYQYTYNNQLHTGVQKQCWDVETMLDIRIPPSVIPKDLLNSSIQFLNRTVHAIDMILKPLTTITIVVFVTCLLSWVVYFVALINKNYSCMGTKPEQQKPGTQCGDAITQANQVEIYMHYVCDRVFCPSAPTAQVYFKEQTKTDCKNTNAADIAGLNKNTGCGKEYMDKWDSACLMMDELERSKCLAYDATKDPALASACGSPAKNLFYTISDFCKKKDQPTSKRIKMTEGGKVSEFYIDENGGVHRVGSVIVEEVNSNKVKDCIKAGTCKSEQAGPSYETFTVDSGYDNYIENSCSVEGGKKVCRQIPHTVQVDANGYKYYDAGVGSDKKTYYKVPGKTGDGAYQPESYFKDKNGNYFSSRERIPDALQNARNLPGARRVVVNPTDNLATALQCVCLPAINGFLTMWRNILNAIMQCFQSILITGDGSSGLCRAVLTQYICDLIFDAIRCFVNKYSTGDISNKADENSIGKFFSSVATAGKDIKDSITGRYGKSGLYNTMFNERKLIRAACLYAFTGDFDFDVGGALTGAGAIPLNSEGFLYPHDRRYLGSNPLTGYATHIYHIGAGLVAGADLSYRLELVCSATPTCSYQEGFAGGKCDCYNTGKEITRDITYSFGPGSLYAGSMLGPNEGDIYVKITDDRYRYDKVRLTWTFRNNEGKQDTKIKEEPINQIGGNAPVECKFDLGSNAFRCAYEIGNQGYAIFTKTPNPDKSYYGTGDTINLQIEVDKRSPAPPSQQYAGAPTTLELPFYIHYEVSIDGKPLAANLGGSKDIPIFKEGVQALPNIPGVLVTQDKILQLGTSTGVFIATDKVAPGSSKRLTPINPNSGGASITSSFALYVKKKDDIKNFGKSGASIDVNHYIEAYACLVNFDNKDNFKFVNGGDTCAEKIPVTQIEIRPTAANNQVGITYGGVKMLFGGDDLPSAESNKWGSVVFKIAAPQAASSAQCTASTVHPQVWNINVGLYPCEKINPDLDYSFSNCRRSATAVNYYQTIQQFDVPVNVICSQGAAGDGGTCDINRMLIGGCQCGQPGNNPISCGKDMKSNYCYYYGVDFKCMKYFSCKANTQINVADDINSVSVDKTIWCDCDGDKRMDECTNKWCWQKDAKWGCYDTPPALGP